MSVRIMTLVTNFNGMGPGHSAVVVDTTVYTFEDTGGWFSSGSGWKKIGLDMYLKSNEHRPVLLQTTDHVNGDYVTEYVDRSIADDDDYMGSGVCSTQVARAVNYGLPENVIFEPKGFDTPFGVFHCARRMKLVASEQYIWTGKSKLPVLTQASITNKLKSDYPGVADNI